MTRDLDDTQPGERQLLWAEDVPPKHTAWGVFFMAAIIVVAIATAVVTLTSIVPFVRWLFS